MLIEAPAGSSTDATCAHVRRDRAAELAAVRLRRGFQPPHPYAAAASDRAQQDPRALVNVVHGVPPLYDELDQAFGVRTRRGVIFTFGSTIYVPDGFAVSPELRAHEAVHCERQGDDVEGWWRSYMASAAFRLAEEVPAHRAEYRAFCGAHRDRNARARFLTQIAGRLAGPLYGRVGLTVSEARQRIAG